MKHLFTLLATLFFSVSFTQTYNSPESVEYDAPRDRYIVANTGGNNLLQVVPGNAPTLFKSGVTSPYGLVLVGDTVYVCSQSSYIKAYNLVNGNAAGSINTGGTFLNGICTDFKGNIFATDFSAKKIYRMDIATQQFNVFVANTVKTPNGIVYDPFHNRLVVATWGTNASILGLSLTDSSITTLKSTTLSNIDGISIDEDGNFYFTSWLNGAQGVYFLDSAMSNAPIRVVNQANSTNPADIHYNQLRDTLAVPNTSTNTVTFHGFPRPVVVNDVDTVCVDSSKTICVLDNDAISSGSLLVQSITSASLGTATLNLYCVNYAAAQVGNETINYQVCSNASPSFCKTGTLTVTNVACASQQAQPVADFSFTAEQFNEPCIGSIDPYIDNIVLTNTSQNADSIRWSVTPVIGDCIDSIFFSSLNSISLTPVNIWSLCAFMKLSVCITAFNSVGQSTKCDTTCSMDAWESISELPLSNIRIFPNPTNDNVSIDMSKNQDEITKNYSAIEIVDVQGKKVKTISRNNQNGLVKVGVSDFPEGIYLAGIVSERNEFRVLGKFSVVR